MLRTLHTEFGLAKQFIKALKSDSKALSHLQAMFPKLSEAKVKVGSQDHRFGKCLAPKELEDKMTTLKRDAWQSFCIVHGFLGRNEANNYEDCVETSLQTYCKLGCRMSLKMHYLHSRVDFFRPNLTKVSEEHGGRFHQNIQAMEKRYQGRWDEAMMGNYVWILIRDDI